MSVKCSGCARDPAKVEDQVRFLTWTLMNNMACECDGFARQSSKLLDKVRFLGELLLSMVRCANWHSDCDHPYVGGARTSVFVGSNPTHTTRV